MAELDDWITRTLGGLNTQQVTVPATDADFSQLLKDRPDVLAEYNRLLPTIDWNSSWAAQHGFYRNGKPEDFARWWYNNGGGSSQYQLASQKTPTPTTPAPTTPDPSPANPTPTAPTPQETIQSTIDKLLGSYNDQLAKQQALEGTRANARNQVNSQIGTGYGKINAGLLSDSVNKILGDEYGKALTQIERGKARGQYNDVGYNAAIASLDKNKTQLGAKLNTTANDVLSGYRTRYDDVRKEALDLANNLTTNDQFNLGDYVSRGNEIVKEAQDFAPGALLSAVGNAPLFNLSNIRSDAGTAQGALNLKDMDVIDALAKRKQAQGVGRGLGSQGSF